jgi:nicotinamide mononucleotide (NMN) deamidase PncC
MKGAIMPERYELDEADVEQIERAAKYTLIFEEQGVGQAELYLRDAEGISRLFHNVVVIYGRERAINLLEVVQDALMTTPGFVEMHEAYLLALDVKRGLSEVE